MADLAEVFRILRDDSTGAGESPVSRIEGEVAAAKEGLIGFSFKDSTGNVILPTLTSDGKLPVDTEASSGTCYYAHGELAAGSATLVDITSAEFDLGAPGNVVNRFGINVSCLRTALFQLVYVDDADGTPAETVLDEWIVGAGAYTVCCQLDCLLYDTTAGTGTQKFKLKGQNVHGAGNLSSLRGTVSGFEVTG